MAQLKKVVEPFGEVNGHPFFNVASIGFSADGKMLLTGMSDGGTFCYVTGFDAASPFTHLAPVAARGGYGATTVAATAHLADRAGQVGLEPHVAVGDDADEVATPRAIVSASATLLLNIRIRSK